MSAKPRTPTETPAKPVSPLSRVRLVLDEKPPEGAEPIAHDVSAAARLDQTLFLAADECAHVEVLDREADGSWGAHRRADLSTLFDLPDPSDEMDVEGLCVDEGLLWVVGSHSKTRRKPKKTKPLDAEALTRFADLKANLNRAFLGCVPLVRMGGGEGLWGLAGVDGDDPMGRQPAMLKIKADGNGLLRRLRDDPHLAPFLELPAKENGLDVEGLVVSSGRVFAGLRGPVIGTLAVLLAFDVRLDEPGRLKMHGDLRKIWLNLEGLGIRDLKRCGDDLLILGGPSMALDGPARVYRWRNWLSEQEADGPIRPERELELPYGDGCEHPEALALLSDGTLLVVSDSPAISRLSGGAILADVFRLEPGASASVTIGEETRRDPRREAQTTPSQQDGRDSDGRGIGGAGAGGPGLGRDGAALSGGAA